MKNLSNKTLIYGFSGIMLLVFLSSLRVSASVNPEELRRQAQEAKRQAMVQDCETIGNRILKCYTGDKNECDNLHESNAWFTNEYGATPQLLCPTGDFLE